MSDFHFFLPPDLVHEDHLGLPSIAAKPGFKYVEAGVWHDWVVKLSFSILKYDAPTHTYVREEFSGTGFYINLPGAACDVILTAGHNLIDKNGKRSTNIRVLTPDGEESSGISISDLNVRISEEYLKRPNESSAAHDYGAILIPRKEHQAPRPGFGFCLMLGVELKVRGTKDPNDEYMRTVNVSGYRSSTQPGKPELSSGSCTIRTDQLEYIVETQVGLSGSPVWTAYNGVETVVAIHNHGKGKSGKSHGTRLNLRVMREIFRWANIDRFKKRLRVKQDGAHTDGLYLHFAEEYWLGNSQVGKVYIGREGMDSTFDVLLAETPPTPRMDVLFPRYALIGRVPWVGTQRDIDIRGANWLVWDIDSATITLSQDFHPWCFVRLEEPGIPDGTFRIVVSRDGQLKRLKMDTSSLTRLQIKMGRRDVNGCSFVRHIKGGKKFKFDTFCLEDQA